VFSGLVKGTGRVAALSDADGDRRLVVDIGTAAIGPLAVGGSIAVNGVCLTAVTVEAQRFAADVSAATLAVTTLGRLVPGARVNLEPPLKAGDPLDGHIVTGHVDGVGEVVALDPAGGSLKLVLRAPAALARYIAAKGSVAIDGVSLTVNAVRGAELEVNIIPHTRAATVIGEYARGTAVNIEVDMLARYLERLVTTETDKGRLDLDFLKNHGYARDR
jgi:riboflavin synthase